MATMTIQIPTEQVGWFEQMVRTMGWVFTRNDSTADATVDNSRTTELSMISMMTEYPYWSFNARNTTPTNNHRTKKSLKGTCFIAHTNN